ncbi:MAG: lysine exporter LysO family protein [Clostridia bacterium]|nr:lysine exporter LysO family protein [Clostridia bacterium]
MGDLVLYLGLALVGYLVSNWKKDIKEKMPFLSGIQTFSIFLLIFTMGTRMGSNREIIDNLGTIGVSALVFTAVIVLMVLFGVMAVRKLLGFNRYGEKGNTEKGEKKDGVKVSLNRTTIYIVVAVALGMLFGYFVILKSVERGALFGGDISKFGDLAGLVIKIALSVMLFLVGIDLGSSGNALSNAKTMGYKILVITAANIVLTLSAGVVAALILGMKAKEGLLVASGFGWYSLAPGIIMDAGYITVSAIAFLHNVLREMISIITIPLIADTIGYIETTQIPGAAAMDVCLPVVERATKPEVAIYSFISGSIISILVPVIVPVLINL